jgi:hypothetical protein
MDDMGVLDRIGAVDHKVVAQPTFDPLDVTQFWNPFRSNPTASRLSAFSPDYPDLVRGCETLAYLIRSYTV